MTLRLKDLIHRKVVEAVQGKGTISEAKKTEEVESEKDGKES